MVKVKCGAIVKNISKGALKWYQMAGWKIIEEKKVKLSYAVGDSVVVIAGLFEGYTGTVQSISDDSNKVVVLVNRGRRDMPVELDANVVKLG